jgi:hypothetical protein
MCRAMLLETAPFRENGEPTPLREHDVERDPGERERQDEPADAVTAADERPEPKPRSPAWTRGLYGRRRPFNSHRDHADPGNALP